MAFRAVRDYSRQFDHREPYELTRAQLEEAYRSCPAELIAALEHAAANIRDYNEKLLSRTMEWTSPDGGRVGRIVRGLSRVGIYVPGGTAAYPSSVLMNAVPAKVAGVEEIVMVTPPTENLNAAVLAAARIAGVDRCIAVGGAQAVAALTYGAGFIPRVDKLVGPGNAYVAAAQTPGLRQSGHRHGGRPLGGAGHCRQAGRTRSTWPRTCSARRSTTGLLRRALTDSWELAQAVDREVVRQTGYLERSEIMEESLRDFGCAIVCDSLERCVELANEIAPEHLEIMTEEPRALLPLVKNAGAVFLGAYTPEPLGDYLAGPDHVLPTSGTARFFSPLSVDSFLKTMSVLEFDRAALAPIAGEIITLAETEHLTAHANSIRVRMDG